jgi:hypothetical protein
MRRFSCLPSFASTFATAPSASLLSAVFVGALFAFDVANLWTLVSRSDVGLMAAVMLFMGNGIVFAGVQFGISVMRMGDDDEEPRGGQREPGAFPSCPRSRAPCGADRRRSWRGWSDGTTRTVACLIPEDLHTQVGAR